MPYLYSTRRSTEGFPHAETYPIAAVRSILRYLALSPDEENISDGGLFAVGRDIEQRRLHLVQPVDIAAQAGDIVAVEECLAEPDQGVGEQ